MSQGRARLVLALVTATSILAGCNEATLSLLALPSGAAGSGGDVSDPDAPLSQWPLDVDASDSRSGNHGALQGEVSFVQDAERGSVLGCNGQDTTVIVASQPSLDFSYALWLWTDVPSAVGETAIDGSALLWSNVTGLEDDFTLSLLNDKLSYMSYSQPSTGTRSLVDGAWHHVVLTRRNAERVALYVDGEVDGDGNSGSGDVLGNPSVHFCGNPEQMQYFNGKLDDVRYYPRVLSAQQVRDLHTDTSLP